MARIMQQALQAASDHAARDVGVRMIDGMCPTLIAAYNAEMRRAGAQHHLAILGLVSVYATVMSTVLHATSRDAEDLQTTLGVVDAIGSQYLRSFVDKGVGREEKS